MSRYEIENELKQLPKEWLSAFAARISTQCLLGLLYKTKKDEPIFSYWNDDKRQQNLFFLSRLTVITEFFHTEKSGVYTVTKEDHLKIIKKYSGMKEGYSETSAGYSTGAIFYSVTALIPETDTIKWHARSAQDAKKAGIHISNELDFLKAQLNSGKTPIDYLYQPLYSSQSQERLEQGKQFVQVLRDYGHGFDIWADWFQGRIDGIPTDKEFLEAVVNLSDEILAQEPAQINAYLKNLCQTERPLNRVRVIFLGYGEAGKTSLIRALNGLEVVAGKEQMTPGIDISDWQVPGTEITAHFWDFGGQVVAHATHQFFLRSRCLYILLLDGRTEINANEQAEYWLEHVRAFGSKAPVMLVGNKADLCAVNLDMAALKEKHENVLDFYPLSCTKYHEEYAAHFQRFQADLIKQVAELGVHTVRFGKAHLAVLDELTTRSGIESFLKKTAWLDLCQESGLAEQGDLNQAWVLD
ncbi:MAG: hypothetical protein D3908_03915, partial [Candidatus Electrothrix sp. AUS4]|nr:hypothetical protein [Candidatus Electrothrix sp. AUS4]